MRTGLSSRAVAAVCSAFLVVLVFPLPAAADHAGSPNVTVTPNSDLPDDGPVQLTVTGTGMPADTQVNVSHCRYRSDGGVSCDGSAFPTASSTGEFTVPITVQYSYGSGSECNWSATESCKIVVWSGDFSTNQHDSAAIIFAGHDTRTPSTHALTVGQAGAGVGTVTSDPAGISCGSTCSHSFTDGAVVTLSAQPDAASQFTGWSGDCSGTGSCVVTMSAAKGVTATFDPLPPPTHRLDVTVSGDGTLSSSPAGIACPTQCTAVFDAATEVTLTAAPTSTSRFTGWSGNCSGTATTCTVVMNAAKAVTATFAPVDAVLPPRASPIAHGRRKFK